MECSVRAALGLLGYDQSNATLATLLADPSLTVVLNATLESLQPASCSRAAEQTEPSSNVWDQIKRFLNSFTDNPAGASLSVSVMVIAAVTVYVLLKYIHHRVQNLPMRAARVWEFAQTMRNFMERLIPGSDSDLQVDDLAGLAVPDPDLIVALERGTGPTSTDPPTDYYSPVESSDSELYTTPHDSIHRASTLPRVKDELNTPRGRPRPAGVSAAGRVPRLYPSLPSLPRTLEYPPASGPEPSSRSSAPVNRPARPSPTAAVSGNWRQPAVQTLESTDEEVLYNIL